jgi:hypothetical protein
MFCLINDRAKKDERFLDALEILKSKMVDEEIVVERVVSEAIRPCFL